MIKLLKLIFIILSMIVLTGCLNNVKGNKNSSDDLDNLINKQVNNDKSNISSLNEGYVKSDKYSSSRSIKWLTFDAIQVSDQALDQLNIKLADMGFDFYLDIIKLDITNYKKDLDKYLINDASIDIISCFLNNGDQPLDNSILFVEDGNLVPLDEYLTSVDGKILYESINEKLWKSTSNDGKIYLIPNSAMSFNPEVYYFNDIYIPKDYVFNEETFIALCKGFDLPMDNAFLIPYVATILDLGRFIKSDPLCSAVFADCQTLKIDSLFNQPGFIQFITMLNRFYKEGLISKDLSLKNNSNYRTLLEDNNYVVALAITTDVKTDTRFEIIPNYITSGLNGSIGISSKSTQADDAFKLLSLIFTQEELANLLIYGIEEVDYVLVDNTVQDKDAFLNEMAFGLFNNIYPPSKDKNRVYKKQEQINNTLLSPYAGFNFNPLGYEDIIIRIEEIAFKNLDVWKEDDFENKISSIRIELEEAGINQLIDAVKEQVEAWEMRN